MYIEATKLFLDREEDFKMRDLGDIWEVSEARGKKLIELGYAVETKKPKRAKNEKGSAPNCKCEFHPIKEDN